MTLNTSIASDYTADPFWVTGKLTTNHTYGSADLLGTEIVIGPSSNASFDGTVEHGTVASLSGGVLTFQREYSQTHITNPFAAYAVGDQVVIRTVPLGWTPSASFSSKAYAVRPAIRYQSRDSLAWIVASSGLVPTVSDYEYRKGVQIATTNITTDSNRYIEKYSPVNSLNPRVRRYRSSWYYRLLRANQSNAASVAPTSIDADIIIGAATGDGVNIFPVTFGDAPTTENTGPLMTSLTSGNNDLAKAVVSYGTSDTTSSWVMDSKLMSYSSSDDNQWDMGGNVATNPQMSAFNRANRWFVRARLRAGANTAFELDDLIIEHAHGTSQEANGFYEIEDYADPDTISWRRVDVSTKSTRLANGSLKISALGDSRPRYAFSADFVNVSGTIYDDIEALISHQRRTGDLICIRPFGTLLPAVMVGKLSMSRRDLKHWDLGKASFTIEFEEA